MPRKKEKKKKQKNSHIIFEIAWYDKQWPEMNIKHYCEKYIFQ